MAMATASRSARERISHCCIVGKERSVNGHSFSPLVATKFPTDGHQSPHWWPSLLLTRGLDRMAEAPATLIEESWPVRERGTAMSRNGTSEDPGGSAKTGNEDGAGGRVIRCACSAAGTADMAIGVVHIRSGASPPRLRRTRRP